MIGDFDQSDEDSYDGMEDEAYVMRNLSNTEERSTNVLQSPRSEAFRLPRVPQNPATPLRTKRYPNPPRFEIIKSSSGSSINSNVSSSKSTVSSSSKRSRNEDETDLDATEQRYNFGSKFYFKILHLVQNVVTSQLPLEIRSINPTKSYRSLMKLIILIMIYHHQVQV